jgi:DNA recombination protein RmuC
MKSYDNIGDAIKKAQKAFEEGEKKLSPSGQSILQTCSKLEKLGAKQNRKHPIRQLGAITDVE